MRFRKSRIAWSVGCAIACVLLIVLWVRSYWRSDHVNGRLPNRAVLFLDSVKGRVGGSYMPPENNLIYEGWSIESQKANSTPKRQPLFAWTPGFSAPDGPLETILMVPHWLPLMLISTFAGIPWIRWRFTLRTLLIATTLVAVVLGQFVW